jgi:hypothetical protein
MRGVYANNAIILGMTGTIDTERVACPYVLLTGFADPVFSAHAHSVIHFRMPNTRFAVACRLTCATLAQWVAVSVVGLTRSPAIVTYTLTVMRVWI